MRNVVGRGSKLHRRMDSGSIIPLGLGLFLVAVATFMLTVDLFFLHATKFRLERFGEALVTNSFKDISYEKFFLDDSSSLESNVRRMIPFECSDLISKIKSQLQVSNASFQAPNAFKNSKVDAISEISATSVNCVDSQLRIVLAQEVQLPFQPPIFGKFRPVVTATISGGVQRIRGN